MYLIKFDAGDPVLIGELEGFLYSIQPQSTNGYRDLVDAGHISAGDTL